MKLRVIWFGFSCVGQSIDAWLKPPPAGLAVSLPEPDASFEVFCWVAIVGQFLGMAGVRLAMRMKGTISPLSLLGIGLCGFAILPMYLMLIVFAFYFVLPFLLPVFAVMAITGFTKQRWG
jgi:hypothetical protein